jgi:hypothetical protein
VPGKHGVTAAALASIADELGAWGRAIADPVEAFAIARRNADAVDIVVVTGSTFVVSVLRSWWMANVCQQCLSVRSATRGALRVRDRVLPWGVRTYVMGIVNVSPDSFSGDGDPDPAAAAARALAQLADGATASTSALSRRGPGTRRSMPRPNARA